MGAADIDFACFRDEEGHRDPALAYLSGLPGDGVLILSAGGESVLAAWDVILASRTAEADRILPYGDCGRSLRGALARLLPEMDARPGQRVELPLDLGYREHLEICAALSGYELLCGPESGAALSLERMRAVKDDDEIGLYRRAAAITDQLMDGIAARVASGRARTEADIALFIEGRCRELGCQGTGFETLCAGPGRSFGIHAFPSWTAGPFGGPGMSILDFGLKLEGYVTDVTMSFLRPPLHPAAERMAALVEEAYAAALASLKPGAHVLEPLRAVEAVFSAGGFRMPHALGHGIGLEAHEDPVLRDRPGNDWRIQPGMVLAIEPGLYHEEAGGLRWENDFLITEGGAEQLTHSRIVRL